MFSFFRRFHDGLFFILRKTEGWIPGLAARFVFAGVLFMYFFNSAKTKVEDLPDGFFQVKDNAFFQIIPSVVERFDYDASQVPLIPYKLIVYVGTYAEFILPVLIILGLFTRISAVGMIIFVLVQSYVDINVHAVGEEATGALFDRFSNSTILDQRALWVFLLLYLAVYGAGKLSVDYLFSRKRPIRISSRPYN